MNALRFFNPFAEVHQTANRLPHWQQAGAAYFLTFRLADALPAQLRRELDNEEATWRHLHPQPWSDTKEREYNERFSGAIERWLDAGFGACLLRTTECSQIVMETLRHFEGERTALLAAVVMPNHVHTLFVQNAEWPLDKIVYSWKTFTAKRINAVLKRSGTVWQRDYFDRLVRDQKHFENCVRYIRRNPEVHLPVGSYILYESDIARGVQ